MPTYLAGKNATVTIDGVSMKVEAGTINRNVETDPVTNNFSGGFYEDVDTIRLARVSGMRCVYDADDPPTIDDGDLVTVGNDRGSVTLPLVVADLPDRVVWLPTRSPDAAVRRDLAAVPGDLVRLSTAAPTSATRRA